MQKLKPLPNKFRNVRALVVGDAMLDSYCRGTSRRLCQEAPVPIVEAGERFDMPGGAGNCAANLAALGAKTTLLTAIGDDSEGEMLCRLLDESGAAIDARSRRPSRKTLSKSRIMADQQLVVRVDRGSTEPLDAKTEADLLEQLESLYPQADVVVVSDYGYGTLTPAVITRLAALGKKHEKVLAIDSKNLAAYREAGATVCKPNFREAVELLAEYPPYEENRGAWLLHRGPRILETTGARIASVTLDGEGAVVFEKGQKPCRTFARSAPSHRAAGAGDTYLCAFALALAAGVSTLEAAELASSAAALAVSKEFTATCSLDELLRLEAGELFPSERLENLARTLEEHRARRRRIVLTNGCFDILHRGHIAYLEQAKRLGDVLVVGVNTDASIRRLKGAGRPINRLRDRIEMLMALSSVDHAVAFEEDTPHRLIEIVRPDVFVKGGDYTREQLPEASLVERLGGTVKILPYLSNRSTTDIIRRVCRMHEEEHSGNIREEEREERIDYVFPTMGNGKSGALHSA